MSDIVTSEIRASYWRSVEGIAQEILEEHYGDHDAISEAVTEYVDSSEWIIYTGKQLAVLLLTENDPSMVEIGDSDDCSWSRMQTTAAFVAMEGDVWDAIRRKEEDADTECPACGGDGEIERGDFDSSVHECPHCEGTGEINPFAEKEK